MEGPYTRLHDSRRSERKQLGGSHINRGAKVSSSIMLKRVDEELRILGKCLVFRKVSYSSL